MSALVSLPEKPLLAGVNYVPLPKNAEFTEMRLALAKPLTDEELLQFSGEHRDFRIEQSAAGELIIMLPLHTDSGFRESKLLIQFARWEGAQKGGELFDSNAGFTLPNGAMRAPDVSWVRQEQLDRPTPAPLESFAPLYPAFVAELRSRADRLPTLQEKMVEYLDNGARLGWLIDPLEKQVFIYRPGQPVEHLTNPTTLSGESVLAGFTLDLARVW